MDHPDILDRLKEAALSVDDTPVAELEDLLKEAARVIETLRTLVGIRDEIELEDTPAEGNA